VRPQLAICIPTYGRAATLEALLARLASEAPDVPVLVADNASPDGTPDVLRRAERPGLGVHRQPSNLGPTANIRWVLSNAPDAEYTWLFCDDDLPAPGAIAAIRALLSEHEPDWLHLPHRWVDEQGTVVNRSPCPAEAERHVGSGALYRARGHWLTFASASVLRRDALARAAREVATENAYAPLVWFVEAAGRGSCVVAPFCAVDAGTEITWADRMESVFTIDYPALFEEALSRHVDAAEFAASLDELFGTWRPELWRSRERDHVADVLARFPRFRVIRRVAAERAARTQDAPLLRQARAAVSDDDRAAAGARRLAGEDAAGRGELEQACGLLDDAVTLDPVDAESWNDLGVVLHMLGQLDGSIDALQIALGIAPERTDARENLAAILAA
jgi:glycosyltransferase involved in cell wall biosynthesis